MKGREREVVTRSRSGPGQSQKLGIILVCHVGQVLGPSSTVFPGTLAGSWVGSVTARTGADTMMWDACGISKQWLIHCATTLTPAKNNFGFSKLWL